MAQDVEIIKELEKELGKKLEELPLDKIGGGTNGFSVDEAGR